MRSPRELGFRIVQQLQIARLLVFPPKLSARHPIAELPLPPGRAVAERLRGTPYAEQLEKTAREILAHRIPLFGGSIEVGGQIEWRKDHVSGRVTPARFFRLIPYLDFAIAGDHKVIWELSRHQHLVLLAQIWLLSENRAYLEELEAQLESWWAQNPFLLGINYASALEVAFRALSWLWIDHLAGNDLRTETRGKLLNGLFQHGHYLEANLSTYFSPNTHLLGEGVALHALGLKFPESGWAALGNRIVAEERDRQIQADGSHFEQSTYYHVYGLDFFLFYYLLAARPDSFREPLRRMAHFLAAINGPAGLLNFFGDDDGGRLFHPFGERAGFGRASLATSARIFPEERFPLDAESAAEQAAWWLGVAESEHTSGEAAQDSAALFPHSGLVSIVRGDLHILIDTGPFGPGGAGHSHSDTLSLTVRRGARELLIDPGTFTYVADPEARDRFRGSGFHNTVRVDGRDQADPTRPFRWDGKPRVTRSELRVSEGVVDLAAACVYREITHRRQFQLLGDRVLFVQDNLTGPAGRHRLEQFWHLGGDADGGLTILTDAPGGLQTQEGWRSRCLGSRERTAVRACEWEGEFPVRIVTALVFGSVPAFTTLNVRDRHVEIPGVGAVEFRE